jgi:cytochrome P450
LTAIVASPSVDALLDELMTLTGREDPYLRYAQLRTTAPVARASDGALVVTRYADCHAVVRDPRFVKAPVQGMLRLGYPDWEQHAGLRLLATSMLAANPPDHTRLRRLVSGAFTPRRVERLRPAVARLVTDLLAGVTGDVDFVGTFAFPLPVTVIGELLGVPEPDRAQFQGLVRDWTQLFEVVSREVVRQADAAAVTMRDYLADLVAARRRQPADDLLSALVAVEEAGDRLSKEELLTTATLLFAAGFETTTHLLGNGLVALLCHPDQLADWRGHSGDGQFAAGAVEELLRFDSPVQILIRVAAAELELTDVTVSAGERVIAYLGAGNRDPARFADPDRLDLRRLDNAPLSFGGGIHYCLGAALARLEAQIAFPALLAARPRPELTGDPVRRDSLTLRGYTSIPISAA